MRLITQPMDQGSTPVPPMDFVLSFLNARRTELQLEQHGIPERLSCVVLTPRFRASSHVIGLLVAERSGEVVLVAKVPRLRGRCGSLEREAANLRAVQAARPGGYSSIPRLVAFEEYRGWPILLQTALVGPPMDRAVVRRDRARCCIAALRWLEEVQVPACPEPGRRGNGFERLVREPLEILAERVPLPPDDECLLDRTWELVGPLRHAPLPLVMEHGDLSHPNLVLLRDGGLGVVDWELAEPHGLPGIDLFFFLTYAAFAQRNAQSSQECLAAFDTAFFRASAWAAPYVREYIWRLSLSPETTTSLFVACWVRYLAGLLLRLRANSGPPGPVGPETADWLRSNRYFALWRHAVAHANTLAWTCS